jgi:hypothetical protein
VKQDRQLNRSYATGTGKMKKIVLILVLIMLITTTYAGKNILDTVAPTVFRISPGNKDNIEWSVKDSYDAKSFMYHGRKASAYYKNGNVLGFSMRFYVADDLPKEVLRLVGGKYPGYKIADIIIYLDYKGNAQYYVGVKNSKKYKALKISSNCKLSVMENILIR